MYIEEQLDTLVNVLKQGFADLAEAVRLQAQTQHVEDIVAKPNGAAESPEEIVEKRGPTFDEVVAIAQELARRRSQTQAQRLIQKHGGGKLADMPKEKYAAFVAAATVLLSEPAAEL